MHLLIASTYNTNTITDEYRWIDDFLKYVYPNLNNKKDWYLLIDNKKPNNFNTDTIPSDLNYLFYDHNTEKAEQWLQTSDTINYLYSDFIMSERIWKYEDKFNIIFVHSYPKDINNAIVKDRHSKDVDHINDNWYDIFLSSFKTRIWTGIGKTVFTNNYKTETYGIPNFYKFSNNSKYKSYFVNDWIGYINTSFPTNNYKWLIGHESHIVSNIKPITKEIETKKLKFDKAKFYELEHKNIDFVSKSLNIFHGAYSHCQFGYIIFDIINLGKLPIIHTEWFPSINYRYRAHDRISFNKALIQMKRDNQLTREIEWKNLKTKLSIVGNKDKWINSILYVLQQ